MKQTVTCDVCGIMLPVADSSQMMGGGDFCNKHNDDKQLLAWYNDRKSLVIWVAKNIPAILTPDYPIGAIPIALSTG